MRWPSNTAVGSGATASGANSMALGAGAQATLAGEVSVGTASNTYTLAGVTSATSLSRQSGTISFVTTDANGHLGAAAIPAGLCAEPGGGLVPVRHRRQRYRNQCDRRRPERHGRCQ
jgi:putative hemolysin